MSATKVEAWDKNGPIECEMIWPPEPISQTSAREWAEEQIAQQVEKPSIYAQFSSV